GREAEQTAARGRRDRNRAAVGKEAAAGRKGFRRPACRESGGARAVRRSHPAPNGGRNRNATARTDVSRGGDAAARPGQTPAPRAAAYQRAGRLVAGSRLMAYGSCRLKP